MFANSNIANIFKKCLVSEIRQKEPFWVNYSSNNFVKLSEAFYALLLQYKTNPTLILDKKLLTI